jgi:hypothetical protein
MYDETGVTAGFMQWTFKSGRLQKLLQFLKSIDCGDQTLFDLLLYAPSAGRQVFESFGFKIESGQFCANGKVLDPRKKAQQKAIVDICMGRRAMLSVAEQKKQAKALCTVFAELGQELEFQFAQIEFAKLEFKRALDARRPPLKSVGGTIRCLLPDEVWGSPIPAIFFNLFQNMPGGSFTLFKNAWKTIADRGDAELTSKGYRLKEHALVESVLETIWKRLNRTAYADWGFRSKQYLESGGKNPPRIMRIKPAIEEFYGEDLPYYK